MVCGYANPQNVETLVLPWFVVCGYTCQHSGTSTILWLHCGLVCARSAQISWFCGLDSVFIVRIGSRNASSLLGGVTRCRIRVEVDGTNSILKTFHGFALFCGYVQHNIHNTLHFVVWLWFCGFVVTARAAPKFVDFVVTLWLRKYISKAITMVIPNPVRSQCSRA